MRMREIACGVLLLLAANGAAFGQPREAAVTLPQKRDLQLERTYTGKVEAAETARLYPRSAAIVEDVLVRVGDAVKKGQELVRLDTRQAKDEAERCRRQMLVAEAELAKAKEEAAAAKGAIATAQAGAKVAEAAAAAVKETLEDSVAQTERIIKLFAQNAASREEYDRALAQRQRAREQYAVAQTSAVAAKAKIEEADAVWRQREATVGVHQARLDAAKGDAGRAAKALVQSQITSPLDGTVTHLGVARGEVAKPEKAIVEVADVSKLRIVFHAAEGELGPEQIRVGAPVVVAAAGQDFQAAITRAAPAVDPKTRQLRLEASFANPAGKLTPGVFAQVKVRALLRGQMTIPESAVVRGKEIYCFRVVDGKAVRLPLLLGPSDGTYVQAMRRVMKEGAEPVGIPLDGTEQIILDPKGVVEGESIKAVVKKGM
jgi:multidrug efflux pump subunit AcrA (membrane-fusion protein)